MMTSATGLRAQVDDVSDSEAFEVFDRVVRHEMDITGVEFLRRHDAGAYEVDPDSIPGLPAVLTVLPFAR